MATEQTANGYALWFAVYVKKLNWFTPIYMALITPMLTWIIYPAMLKGVKRRWEQTFPKADGGQGVADAAQRQAGQAIQDQRG
jgi:hypothetical protein